MFFIRYYDFEKINDYVNLVWEYSFKNMEQNEKDEIFEDYKKIKLSKSFKLENGNLEIITKNSKRIFIENIDDYYLESLFIHLKLFGKFNEKDCIKYVKIQKIKDHLYINKIMKNWIIFNSTIFNSKTIKTLYNALFEEHDSTILNEDELSIILSNITYFAFPTNFKGMTKKPIMKIYEYGKLPILENDDISKLIYLAFLLDINEQEILGNYNIEYQKLGHNIEIELYGRIIEYFTLKEALFVMNIDNYQQDYNSFREHFMKCNENEIKITEVFESILQKLFNIDIKNVSASKYNISLSVKFIKRYTDNFAYIMKEKHPIGYFLIKNFELKCFKN